MIFFFLTLPLSSARPRASGVKEYEEVAAAKKEKREHGVAQEIAKAEAEKEQQEAEAEKQEAEANKQGIGSIRV